MSLERIMGWIVLAIAIVIIITIFNRFRSKMPKIKSHPRNNPDISFLPEQFIVFDLETTGLNPEKDEIIEIGAVKVNRDYNKHDTFTILVRPNKKLPKRISEITGITSEMLQSEGDSLEIAIKEFLQFAGNLRLVAFNAPFDYAFLLNAVSRFGKCLENPISCALDMAKRAWPGLRSYKLENLANLGGLNNQGTHRALKDCELTITVYCAAANKLRSIE
jgi:DNA polymerase III epsilon subunit family exonuclease